MTAVKNVFPNYVISRYRDITWPARSPDLSACDFFLWGYLKFQVFKAPAPHTVQKLKQNSARSQMNFYGDASKSNG
jgi:hypothetical protein